MALAVTELLAVASCVALGDLAWDDDCEVVRLGLWEGLCVGEDDGVLPCVCDGVAVSDEVGVGESVALVVTLDVLLLDGVAPCVALEDCVGEDVDEGVCA